MAHVTDTNSIERKIVITLTEEESRTLYGILISHDGEDDDEKALATSLIHFLEVPIAPLTLS